MTVSRILLVVPLLLLFVGCQEDSRPMPPPGMFDMGMIDEGVYYNDYFQLEFPLPSGWQVQNRERMNAIAQHGKDLVAGENNQLREQLNAADVTTAYLISVFRYPLQTESVEFNPSIMIVVENLRDFPEITTSQQYLDKTAKALQQSSMEYSIENPGYQYILGNREFTGLLAQMNYQDAGVKQEFYSLLIRRFNLGVVLAYKTEAERVELLRAIQTLKINLSDAYNG